jgi:hypothetical protein
LVALVASTSLLTVAVASAQDYWNGYGAYQPYAGSSYAPPPPPPPAYGPGGYPQDYAPYGQGGYAQGPYAQGNYADGPYAQDPYAAQRRAWRRRQAQGQYDQAYAGQPTAPTYAQPAAPPSPAFQAAPVDAPPPPPPAETAAIASVAPPAAPKLAAPTSVALAHKVVESASAYLAYMHKASQISAAFTDGAGVAKEVKTGAAYEPKQFEEGAIAYAAIVALQEPAFIEGVRQAGGGDPDRAAQIAASLTANPASAATFLGADAAAARASAALRRQGDMLMEAGVKVKQSAYDVQHAAWSKGDVLNPETRLAGAKTLSATRLTPQPEETDKLLKLVLAEQGAAAYPGEGAVSPVVSRGLALAAMAVLGQAGEGAADRLQPLMAEEKGGECLHMAKLNLFQCLAVAGPHYEDIFCLGQHAMMDTAQCVIAASGVSHPVMTASAAVVAPPAPAAPVTAAPQDYWVPLGAPAAAGSEAAKR